MKAQLIVVQGKPEGKVIPLAGPVFRIGRGETCHLRPSSEQVSREHAEFQIGDDAVLLRDLGSRNGTFVNGKALTEPTPLKDRDLVQIGLLTFAVSIEGAAVPSAKAAPAQKPVSPDDVTHDEIESWLVSDADHPTPDRPSAVYTGDTVTVSAYTSSDTPTADAPVVAKKEAPAKPKAPAPAPAAAPAAAPAPKAPAAASAAPAPKPPATPAPPPLPKVEAPAAKPMAPAAKVEQPAAAAALEVPSFFDVDTEYERLPEGEGDVEEEAGAILNDDNADEPTSSSDDVPEEFIDESNPFYVKKKPAAAEPEKSTKPSYKDTSDAASDILKKMMERRRSSK